MRTASMALVIAGAFAAGCGPRAVVAPTPAPVPTSAHSAPSAPIPRRPFELPAAAFDAPATLGPAMADLARDVLGSSPAADDEAARDDRFRFQMVAGLHAEALATLRPLRAARAKRGSPQLAANDAQYEILGAARAASGGAPSAEALGRAFREVVGALDDRTAALVMRALHIDPGGPHRDLDGLLRAAKDRGPGPLPIADARALVRAYQIDDAYRALVPAIEPFVAEDDARRYAIGPAIPVRTPDGATVCAMVVRPRAPAGRLPALLNFTIYADPITLLDEARRTASNGYVGVEGLTRGKGCSTDAPVPYEHDGADAAALIDWIASQPWSDGRVGTFGGSYEGFTQWAAAKHHPKALRAMMPSVAVQPGVDLPMEGNAFQSFVYYWPFYTTTNKTLDDAALNDRARWRRLFHDWYVSGRAYRDLPAIDGTPNPFFSRWLEHPAVDAYWRAMTPDAKEMAAIDVPILSTTGYYDGAQLGAVRYFLDHHKYAKHPEHYLVIGPYDHVRGQRGTVSRLGAALTNLRGYETDPAAQIDLGELRYAWFDYALRGGPKPAILADTVSYEVMGGDVWRHAPSIALMGPDRWRLYLTATKDGDTFAMRTAPPAGDASAAWTVDLADRSDVDRLSPVNGIVDPHLDTWGGVAFTSEPVATPTEVSGLFAGRLDVAVNKKDFDFAVQLFEQTAKGEYVELSYVRARASYVGDPARRRLLTPGKRTRLDFTAGRLTSRRFAAGSRLVVVLTVIKDPFSEVDYGTGKTVADETIADAGEPLQVRWFEDSYVDVPVRSAGR
jgi:putative CocE/NonD family hydrolase